MHFDTLLEIRCQEWRCHCRLARCPRGRVPPKKAALTQDVDDRGLQACLRSWQRGGHQEFCHQDLWIHGRSDCQSHSSWTSANNYSIFIPTRQRRRSRTYNGDQYANNYSNVSRFLLLRQNVRYIYIYIYVSNFLDCSLMILQMHRHVFVYLAVSFATVSFTCDRHGWANLLVSWRGATSAMDAQQPVPTQCPLGCSCHVGFGGVQPLRWW